MWLILSLLAAASNTARDATVKTAMRNADEEALMLAVSLVALAVLLPWAALTGIAPPGPGFWRALVVSGTINAVAVVLIARALARSDLSIVAPLQSFTPLFMLATSPLILGERPALLGAVGVAIIVAGAYLLDLPARAAGPLAPFRSLLRDPGARLMLLVAFLYSISSTIDKAGVLASSPVVWGVAVQCFVAAALTLRLAARRFRRARVGEPRWILLAGGALALTIAAQMTALTLTLAAYVIAVKRLSIVFGVFVGHVAFDEARLRGRAAAAVLMLAGVVLITLS